MAAATAEDNDTGKLIDPSPVEDKADAEGDALEQVKDRLTFFFSNANVRQDYFIRKLLTSTRPDEKNTAPPGHVPIEALLRFNTIKQYTTDPAVVIQAAKLLSDVLALDDEEKAIRRVEPFTDDMLDGNIPVSLYVKNVPLTEGQDAETRKYAVTVDDVRALFDKYGDVAIVKLKFSSSPDGQGDETGGGNKKKHFVKKKSYPIGHAMIEFHTQEALEKAAEATLTTKAGETLEPKEKLVVGEAKSPLEVILLSEYVESRKKQKAESSEKNGSAETSKKRDRAEEEDEVEKSDVPTFTVDWKPGCVIQLMGLPEACDREALLGAVAKGLEISLEDVKTRKIYADYSRGQNDGAIRFPEPDEAIAKLATSLKSGDLLVSETKVTDAHVLEGEDEEKYWRTFIEFKNKQIRHKEEEKQSRKKRKKGGGRGGRGGRRY
jgi:hypothetical protein